MIALATCSHENVCVDIVAVQLSSLQCQLYIKSCVYRLNLVFVGSDGDMCVCLCVCVYSYTVMMLVGPDVEPCTRQQPQLCGEIDTCHNDGLGGYTCSCPRGYEGDYCDTDINECLSSPCLGRGVCNVSKVVLYILYMCNNYNHVPL